MIKSVNIIMFADFVIIEYFKCCMEWYELNLLEKVYSPVIYYLASYVANYHAMKIIILIVFDFLLFFFSYKLRTRRKLSGLLILSAAVLLTLLLTEFGYRAFFKKAIPVNIVSPAGSLYTQDSLLGYKFKQAGIFKVAEVFPKSDTIFSTTYTILNDTSSHNFIYNFREGYKSIDNTKEAVFMGCSFTFGLGLPDTTTLPWYYGKMKDISAINLGCIGYGIHQVFELFNLKFAGHDNQNRIFIYPFLYDHILRANGVYSWNNAGPYFNITGDSVTNKGPLYKYRKIKGDKLAWYASVFGTFSIIKDNIEKIAWQYSVKTLQQQDYNRCFIMLRELAQKVNASGGKLVILNWGNYNQFNSPINDTLTRNIDKELSQLTKFGVTVIPVSSIISFTNPRYFIPRDNHPSALANQTIAAWLSKKL